MPAPRERVSVEAAIRTVTRNAAWLRHFEHEIGSAEPGKPADFGVLGNEPRKVESTSISRIEVSATWMNAREVYASTL